MPRWSCAVSARHSRASVFTLVCRDSVVLPDELKSGTLDLALTTEMGARVSVVEPGAAGMTITPCAMDRALALGPARAKCEARCGRDGDQTGMAGHAFLQVFLTSNKFLYFQFLLFPGSFYFFSPPIAL
jgi:hypothetical protein